MSKHKSTLGQIIGGFLKKKEHTAEKRQMREYMYQRMRESGLSRAEAKERAEELAQEYDSHLKKK